MPSTTPRDEFAESLQRSLERRARQDRQLPHPSLLARRERRRAWGLAVVIVAAFFALLLLAALLATTIHGGP